MRRAAVVLSCLLLASCGASETGAAPRVPTGEMTEEPHRGDESLILYVGNESGEMNRTQSAPSSSRSTSVVAESAPEPSSRFPRSQTPTAPAGAGAPRQGVR